MHALTHSLPHRAPSAARAKVRWQPYNAIPSQSSTCTTSPSSSQFNTPSTSVTSPPSSVISAEFTDSKLPTQLQEQPPPPPLHCKDNNKHKYIAGLVDQAVKTLCEIWRPQDIPAVFLSPSRSGITTGVFAETSFAPRKPDLNSTHRLHVPSHFIGKCPSAILQSCCPPQPSDGDSKTNLLHIRGFVHEVLRRSRTPGVVLQTALCYLEAIRPKVADLAQRERLADHMTMSEAADQTVAAATLDDEMRLDGNSADNHFNDPSSSASMEDPTASTVRISDIPPQPSLAESPVETKPGQESSPSVPPLPSTLLCPRRTFLASLILASKFTLDKCYSNRAWAKLSGLPAREIGRCERALGEALEWRLWVGKLPVPASSSSSAASTPHPSQLAVVQPTPTHRPVVRSQSDGNILSPISMRSPFLVRPLRGDGQDVAQHPTAISAGKRTLQRSSTLPAEGFAMLVGTSSWPPIPDISQPKPTPQIFRETSVATSFANNILSMTLTQSPSPDNPGLSYSPSSTDSPNGGERTVQCNFLDESLGIRKCSSLGGVSEQWPWLDTPRNDGIKAPPGMNTLHTDMAKLMRTPDYSGILGSLGSELHGHGLSGIPMLQDYRNWSQDSESTRPCSAPVS